MDSLLGVRHIGSWTQPVGTESTGVSGSSMVSPMFLNPYALSLSLPCDAQSISHEAPEGDNPLERKNALFSQLTGICEPMYTELAKTVEKSEDHQVTWNVDLPADSIGYTYVQTGVEPKRSQYINMIIGNEFIPMEGTRFSHNVRSFGSPSGEGTNHLISVMPAGASTSLPSETTCAVYALNMGVFEREIEQQRAAQFSPIIFKDGYFSGTYQADGARDLLLSIPYDKGWNVAVDGMAVELSPAYGGGMSVLELPKGESSIAMSYHSPGSRRGSWFQRLHCSLPGQ